MILVQRMMLPATLKKLMPSLYLRFFTLMTFVIAGLGHANRAHVGQF